MTLTRRPITHGARGMDNFARTISTGKGGGKKVEIIELEGQAWADAQPVVELCARCDWRWVGLSGEGRQAFAEHLAEAHPEVRPKRHRRGSGRTWPKNRGGSNEQRDDAMLVVAERARAAVTLESRAEA